MDEIATGNQLTEEEARENAERILESANRRKRKGRSLEGV